MQVEWLRGLARLCLATAALAALATLAACEKDNAYVAPPPAKVDVAQPLRQNVPRYLTATGSTSAVNSTSIVARVQGFVEQIGYRDGDTVKAGQMLFVIEPEPYRLALQEAQAAQAGAEATARQSQVSYERQVTLLQKKVASQQDLDNASAQRDADAAKQKQAEVDTEQAALNLGYTEVKAPFDGIVTARQVSIGELVGGGGATTTLATIVELDPIYVDFSVGERDVQRIRAGIAARGMTAEELRKIPVEIGLESETGYPHAGMLDYAAPSVTATTGTLSVRAVFPNKSRVLLPGYFVRVRVPLATDPDRLLVPDRAVGSDQGGRYVLIADKDDVVRQRPVEIGRQVGTMRVIEKGIEPGDRVLVSGLMTAVPGQKIDPQETRLEAAPETTMR